MSTHETYLYTNETYIYAKEMKIYTKETYIYAQATSIWGSTLVSKKKKSCVRQEVFCIVFACKESSSNIEVVFVSKENPSSTDICAYTCMYIHMYSSTDITDVGWLRLVGSIKL